VSDDDARIPEHYAAEVARFFEAHARWLFGHACLRTGRDRELAAGRELAADLVQDTFEAAALAWETLRELSEAQQRAWLRTTLAHKETSHFRRRVTFRRKQADLHHRYRPQTLIPSTRRCQPSRLRRRRRSLRACQLRRRESR
jgi:hypothetical protein